ncbi:MAG: glycoside hydrolase family 5 protein [Burkholderiaceae bacterium]|nr:glycoside hydrolase family 5 protein [Betaproteobacteria bacterium]MBP6647356.1 glycoside hydrolase family 5 protein [Burkholderiaceae bacterium]
MQKNSPLWNLGLWFNLVIVLIMAGCASPMRGNLDAYPPMANDRPPGASAQAFQVAKALGRGINFGNMLEAPNEGDWGLTLRPDFLDAVTQAGFQTVRLPVRWSNHAATKRPFRLDVAFANRVESVVDKLLAKGVYVVLNMHHYRALDGDAPDKGDEPQNTSLSDERFLALWAQIAQRFAGKSDKLIFEIYNEPHRLLDGPHWNEVMARATAAVRKSNPLRVLMIGPVQWNNADALADLRLPNDANLIVTIHNYAPFKFSHQGATWIDPVLPTGVSCCDAAQREEMLQPLDTAKRWSDQNRYPIFVGEFGAYEKADMAARVRFTQIMREEMELRGFGWAYWELAAGFGVYDPETRKFKSELMGVLLPGTRPMPQP